MPDISELSQEQFVDIFKNAGDTSLDTALAQKPFGFGANTVDDFNILGDGQPPITNATEPTADQLEAKRLSDEEAARVAGESGQQQSQDDPNKDPNKDADIFDAKGKGGRPPKYSFTDTSGYFEDRFKSGKFVAITEDREDGSKVPFIPKTPEEFDEVIDIQVNYKLDQERKQLEENWYTTKSPAWQAVSRYADMTDNPADIIPFIQGVQNIETVSSLNPEDLGHAEKIVRTRLQMRGEDAETIEETVDSLKTTDKLIQTATKYKPAMVADEQKNLSAMIQQKRAEEQQYISLVNNIRENAVKAIEAPLFGKHKLKQEEKAAIYDLIAEPSRETKGYQIYNSIDSLFEKGDFDTLKELALFLANKESYRAYINATAADKTAEGLQRKLRVAADTSMGGKETYNYNDDVKTVSRATYGSSTPRFGR